MSVHHDTTVTTITVKTPLAMTADDHVKFEQYVTKNYGGTPTTFNN